MWTSHVEPQSGGRVLRFEVGRDRASISYEEAIQLWRTDQSFRGFFIDLLADVPFSAFRWETPVAARETIARPFEFVILDCPSLARAPDLAAFAEHIDGAIGSGVVEFSNLRGDAVLVVPRPQAPPEAYVHLASFLRRAPDAQKHALWESVGCSMARRLGDRPVWLSTAGAGVAWLHVRLDDRPKYYGYAPYRATS